MSAARRLRPALQLLAGSAALGLALGAAWVWVTPRPRYRVVAGGVVVDELTTGAFVAADGWFAVLALLGGVLCALLARRYGDGPAGVLAGLVLGGALGAVLAWRVGLALAPDDLAVLSAGVDVGNRFEGGLTLRAHGVLLLWPLAALVLTTGRLAADYWAARERGPGGEELRDDRSVRSAPA